MCLQQVCTNGGRSVESFQVFRGLVFVIWAFSFPNTAKNTHMVKPRRHFGWSGVGRSRVAGVWCKGPGQGGFQRKCYWLKKRGTTTNNVGPRSTWSGLQKKSVSPQSPLASKKWLPQQCCPETHSVWLAKHLASMVTGLKNVA